jgi:hypothetical protein
LSQSASPDYYGGDFWFFVLVELGFEFRASCLQNRQSVA